MKLGLGIEKFLNKKAEREESGGNHENLTDNLGVKSDNTHPENKYNSPDEGFLKENKRTPYVPIEEVPDKDNDPEEFINKLSDKLEQELKEGKDKYGFMKTIGLLIETAEKKGEQAVNEVLEKTTEFLTEYREILASGLSDVRNEKEGEKSEGEEYEACQAAFKDIFGGLIYSNNQVEAYRNRYREIEKPKVNAKGYVELGNKIYYDKTGRLGYLSKQEAEEANNSDEKPKMQSYSARPPRDKEIKKVVEKV